MKKIIVLLCLSFLLTSNLSIYAQDKLCDKKIIDTPVGKFEYIGGYPTNKSIKQAYDLLDLQRAAQIYLEFMPAMSVQSIFKAHCRYYGHKKAGDVGVYVYPGKGKMESIGLTYNTESIYASAFTDLKTDGPTVVEVPPNVLGVVNDGWQRYVTDLGNAGPDKGKGGKYLLLPPGYKGDIPEGYYVFKCPTYKNWVMVRGFTKNTGVGDNALAYYKENFKIYPLATGPREDAIYSSMSFIAANTTHPRDKSYFDLLNQMVQDEPSSAFTSYELGLLNSIGIEKGKPFEPDERMQKILSDGIELGDAYAIANAYANRLDGVRVYTDRKYETLFLGGKHDFNIEDTLWLDARTLFHYEAIVITPAMARKMIGNGSQYLTCYKDEDDDYLMGDNDYKLTLPKGIPVKDFWSITAYYPKTRSLLQNGEAKPSISSFDNPEINPDGSIDIYFGPVIEKGKEKNWIKTIPGKGWSILARFYGPLEPYFDKTWKPNDIERLQ